MTEKRSLDPNKNYEIILITPHEVAQWVVDLFVPRKCYIEIITNVFMNCREGHQKCLLCGTYLTISGINEDGLRAPWGLIPSDVEYNGGKSIVGGICNKCSIGLDDLELYNFVVNFLAMNLVSEGGNV